MEFSVYIQELLKSSSTTKQEALALAIGFNPQLERKFKLKYLRTARKSQNLIIKRAAISGLGFSTLSDKKGGIDQKKTLEKSLNDPLTTARMAATIALATNAYFSGKDDLLKKRYKNFQKNIAKQDFIVKQGYSIALGLLAKFSGTQKDSFTTIVNAYDPKMINPDLYLIGLTLAAIYTGRADEGFNFTYENIVPNLLNKENRRFVVICTAFLLPLIHPATKRVETLKKMIQQKLEFHSRFGTDLALILTYFSLLYETKEQKNILTSLLELKELDTDYAQILAILEKFKNVGDILRGMSNCNSLDIKAAGVMASFFVESEENKSDLVSFVEEGFQYQGSGYFDRFLLLLRIFTFVLMNKEYDSAFDFTHFFQSHDQRIKRFAGLSYACLKASKEEFQEVYEMLTSEQDENIHWGLLVGISMYESLGQHIFEDQLRLGLLLLCLGLTDIGTLLLISQAMTSKFYQND